MVGLTARVPLVKAAPPANVLLVPERVTVPVGVVFTATLTLPLMPHRLVLAAVLDVGDGNGTQVRPHASR